MLAYLGTGPRDYATKPVHVHVRGYWEFQAIIAGNAEPALTTRGRSVPHGPRLWVFAPTCPHGWTAPAGPGCRVVVMHVTAVCAAIARAVAATGQHSAPLDARGVERLESLATQLAQEISAPSDRGEPLHQLALAEVSLLALANLPAQRLQDAQALGRRRVESACAWFSEHMSAAPGFDAVAAAAHVSPAHLRRLFWRIAGESPRASLDRLRYQRACELLADPARRLADVAEACGFSEPSALSRGFHAHTGLSPLAWRRRRLRPAYASIAPTIASIAPDIAARSATAPAARRRSGKPKRHPGHPECLPGCGPGLGMVAPRLGKT